MNKRTHFKNQQNLPKSFYSMNYEQRTTNWRSQKRTQFKPNFQCHSVHSVVNNSRPFACIRGSFWINLASFGRTLASFWSSLVSFWTNLASFGTMLASYWTTLGTQMHKNTLFLAQKHGKSEFTTPIARSITVAALISNFQQHSAIESFILRGYEPLIRIRGRGRILFWGRGLPAVSRRPVRATFGIHSHHRTTRHRSQAPAR